MKYLYTLFIIFMFIGCATPQAQPSYQSRPSWIMHPSQDGKIGAIGVAAKGYDLKVSTQRKLAIQRALDELAMQQGVQVTLSMQKQEQLKNNQSSITMQSTGKYRTTSSKVISAHIEDIWEDKLTGELYVWLVLDR